MQYPRKKTTETSLDCEKKKDEETIPGYLKTVE